jgi:hypothetical protein
VVLPEVSDLWQVLWPLKKEIYGKTGLIAVGGKCPGEEDDDPAEDGPGEPEETEATQPAAAAAPIATPRNAGTREPVSWHAMPVVFWQEILFDFKVGAVIDLTPGDGMLALAALQARLPYTGLTYTKKHADLLMHRLQMQVVGGATREGDAWYDPQLVDALTKPAPKPKAKIAPKPKADPPAPSDDPAGKPKDPKAKKKPKPGPKKKPKRGKTPKAEKPEDDPNPWESDESSESSEGMPSEDE